MEIEKIYIKYFHDVFLYIRALSGNESIAEEITQETFVSAMKNLNQFDGRKDIRAWLFTIGKHAYFRYCKRNCIYAEEQYLETMEDSSPPALDQIIREETIQRIETKVEALPSITGKFSDFGFTEGCPLKKLERVMEKVLGGRE